GETALTRGGRHEVRDAVGAGRADDGGTKAAFAPDEPGEEPDRQLIGVGGTLDQPADRVVERLQRRLSRNAGHRSEQAEEGHDDARPNHDPEHLTKKPTPPSPAGGGRVSDFPGGDKRPRRSADPAALACLARRATILCRKPA